MIDVGSRNYNPEVWRPQGCNNYLVNTSFLVVTKSFASNLYK